MALSCDHPARVVTVCVFYDDQHIDNSAGFRAHILHAELGGDDSNLFLLSSSSSYIITTRKNDFKLSMRRMGSIYSATYLSAAARPCRTMKRIFPFPLINQITA